MPYTDPIFIERLCTAYHQEGCRYPSAGKTRGFEAADKLYCTSVQAPLTAYDVNAAAALPTVSGPPLDVGPECEAAIC